MRRVAAYVSIVLILLVIAGCGSMRIKDTKDKDASLVYGYVDMGDAPGKFAWLLFKQMRPVTTKNFWSFWVKDNSLFYHYSVPADSSFSIYEFGTRHPFYGTLVHTMPMYGEDAHAFRVKGKNNLVFLGSFKYKRTGAHMLNLFKETGFELVPSRKPTEKEVLKKLLPLSKGSKWEARIQKRIKELK